MKAGLKPSNPKDDLGSTRIDLSLPSPVALAEEALAYEEGLCKYGRNNYRIVGVRTMIYIAAALRHIWKFTMGEDRDPKTRAHHLGNARACLGIILDAQAYGKLTDDRPPSCAGFSGRLDAMESNVKHMREVFKDHNPRHYTISDSDDIRKHPKVSGILREMAQQSDWPPAGRHGGTD